MDEIRAKFSTIENLRHQEYVKNKLLNILIVIMFTVLYGIDELCERVKYVENKRGFLKTAFGIDKIPSKPIFSRVLNMINCGRVAAIIIEIM